MSNILGNMLTGDHPSQAYSWSYRRPGSGVEEWIIFGSLAINNTGPKNVKFILSNPITEGSVNPGIYFVNVTGRNSGYQTCVSFSSEESKNDTENYCCGYYVKDSRIYFGYHSKNYFNGTITWLDKNSHNEDAFKTEYTILSEKPEGWVNTPPICSIIQTSGNSTSINITGWGMSSKSELNIVAANPNLRSDAFTVLGPSIETDESLILSVGSGVLSLFAAGKQVNDPIANVVIRGVQNPIMDIDAVNYYTLKQAIKDLKTELSKS